MKLADAWMAWCSNYPHNQGMPRVGQIEVGTKAYIERVSDHRAMREEVLPSWLAVAFLPGRERVTATERRLAMFIAFNTVVVRDRLDPEAVHKAFLNIDEYRASIAPDIQGAEI